MSDNINGIRYALLRGVYGNVGGLNDLIYLNSILAPVSSDYRENRRGVTNAYLSSVYPGMSRQNALYQFYLSGGSMGSQLPQSSGIVFNLKAESLALNDGDPVTTWTDSTTNALSFTGTGLFKTNQMNSKPCVRFAGTAGKYMTATRAGTALDTALSSQNCTTMMVVKSNGTNSNGCMFGSTAGGDAYMMVMDGANTNCSVGRYKAGYTITAPSVNASNMVVVAASSATPYSAGAGSGLERGYLNGGCISAFIAPIPAPSQTTFSVGGASAGSLLSAVDVYDIIVWNKVLTPTEVFQATDYFYNKYNQTKPWAAVSNIVVFDGDSITGNVGATAVSGGYPYKTAQSLGLSYGQWTMTAVGGITMTNMTAKYAEWSGIGSLLGKGLRVAAFEYYNQKALSAAAIEAANNAYSVAVRAVPRTKLILGTSTGYNLDPDATRVAVNTYYDTNFATYCDSYVPLHNDTSIGNTAAYAANSATYWSDVVHFKDAGYTILAGLFTTGITAAG